MENKTDLYHFFLPKSYIFGGLLTFFSRKVKIMSRRSMNHYHKKYFFLSMLIEKVLHSKMNKILTNSEAVRDSLVDSESVNKSKIEVIPNFKLVKWSDTNKKRNKKKKIKFGYVANFIPYKDQKRLIEICSNLNVNKDWELELIGNSNNVYGKLIQRKISEFGLQNKIKIRKPTKNIDIYYQNFDFAVSTSKEEGSSNFLLESITFGLPIIAFDVGGNKDFFVNKKFLIPYGNDKKFRRSIEFLINSKSLKHLRDISLDISKRKFDNKITLNKYINIYKNFL